MTITEQLSEAQKWCDAARKALKGKTYSRSSRKDLDKRINKIFDELKTLQKRVASDKFDLSPDVLSGYVERFHVMASGLNTAARTGDLVEVDRQSLRLSQLKKELALELATSSRGKKKAKKRLDERSSENAELNAYVEARDAALERISTLRLHAQATAIDADLDGIESTGIKAAKVQADQQNYPAAMELLKTVGPACDKAASIADQCADYHEELLKVQDAISSVRLHAKAEAAAPELQQAEEKIQAAAVLADVSTRNYDGARVALGESDDLCTAGLAQANRCEAYADARAIAANATTKLGQHARAAVIQPELSTFAEQFTQADDLADVSQRDYTRATTILETITDGVSAATVLADQCNDYLNKYVEVDRRISEVAIHTLADAAGVELDQAAKKLSDAAELATPETRDYRQATDLLAEASDLAIQADAIITRCRGAVDARERVTPLLLALSTLRNRFESVRKELEVLESKLVAANEKASVQKRDYEAATTLFQEIEKAAVIAQAAADKLTWDESIERATKKLLEGLKANSPERTRLEALWALAQEHAANDNYGLALQNLHEIRVLATKALEATTESGGKTVDERMADLDVDARISVALENAKSFVANELQAVVDLGAAFGTNAPAAWTTETDRIAATLATGQIDTTKNEFTSGAIDRDDGLASIEAALDKARADLAEHEKAVRKLTDEKAAWLARWQHYQTKYNSLNIHPGKTASTAITGKVAEILLAGNTCKATADRLDFKAATEALESQITAIAEWTTRANASANYVAARTRRQAEITNAPGSTDVAANAARTAANLCMSEAAQLATTGDYVAAMGKLDLVPGHVRKISDIIRRADIYKYYFDEWKPKFINWEAVDAKYKRLLKVELDPLRATFAEAKREKDNGNIIRAATVISAVRYLGPAAESKHAAVVNFVDNRERFDIKFGQVEDHAGREGIDAFYQRAKSDRSFVNASVAKREFAVAASIIEKLLPEFTDQLALAARYVTYVTKRNATTQKIDTIRDLDTEGKITAELAASDQYLALATEQQLEAARAGSDVPLAAADAALDTALEKAKEGKALLDQAKALQDLKPPGGKDVGALQARIDAFPAMKQHVRSVAGDTSLDPLLDTTDSLIVAAGTALPDDTGTAATKLDEADRILTNALPKAARNPAYKTLLAAVEAAAGTTLPDLNVDPNKCLDEEIKKIKALLTQAKTAVQDPGYDFAQAIQRLTEARVLEGRATEKFVAFTSLAADRESIKQLIVRLNATKYQPALQKERDRLIKIQADIDKQLAAFNFAAARALTAAGKALKAPYSKLCSDYEEVIAKRTNRYAAADTAMTGKPECKIENDEYLLLKPQIDKMIDVDHAFVAAKGLLTRVGYLEYMAKQESKYHKEFTDARKVQADRLGTLKPGNDGVKDLIAEVEATLLKADQMAARREHEQAKLELKSLTARLDLIQADTPRYAAYATAHGLAVTSINTAKQPPLAEAILPLLSVIDAKLSQAEEMAARREFESAENLVKEIPANCTAAVHVANSYSQFDALDGSTADSTTELNAAITKIDLQIQSLQTQPAHEQLAGKIIEAREKITSAQSLIDQGQTTEAADLIREASTACGAAEVHKLHFVQIKQEIATAIALVDGFTSGTHAARAFVAERMASVRTEMQGALQLMVSRGSDVASESLTASITTFRAHVSLADRRETYDKLRLTLEPAAGQTALAELEQHPHRYAAASDIDELRSQMDTAHAAADAPDPDFDSAMAALNKADLAAATARLALAMIDSAVPPASEDIAKVLNQPGGDKKLDAMVENLDPKQRRMVLQEAFQVRFGCSIDFYKGAAKDVTDTSFGPDVMRFYQNFAKVPPQHTLKNDTLLILDDKRSATNTQYGPGGSSDFASWHRTLTMRDGSSATSAGVGLGSEYALGKDVPDDCKPANDDPVRHVDWNSLHEVGHAVDAKYQFMTKHLGDPKFGGWTEYKQDTRKVAEKLVAEFEYDLVYTEQRLAGETNPALPDPPDDVTPETWEQRRTRLNLWVENAAFSKNPWETDSTAQALKLKTGEIIHDAYGNSWVGYLASERSKGITGYQFRSPLEWFSEIYAAYLSGKLKGTHPATSWLKTLETADVT